MSDYNGKIYSLLMQPGILRDGTKFARPNWIDGQWTRFYRSLPKKMGGYSQINPGIFDGSIGCADPIGVTNIPRGMYVTPNAGNYNVIIGDSSRLYVLPIDASGNQIGCLATRTPTDFLVDGNNEWSFDVMFSTVSNSSTLIAFAAPNLYSITSAAQRPIYYGDINADTPLVPTGTSVSGGIVVLQPYLFMLDNDGHVFWSEANDPTTIMGDARIASYKLVAGLPTRGGNSSPAGLIWSLDRLIRVTQVGTSSVEFAFDTVAGESSILSSNSIVEYDNIYYWCGVDRFLYYNGVVNELPNDMSLDYFFKNLNFAQRQKVWATKVPRWGEIWWHYPSKNSTECDSAIIFNVRESKWYDTNIARSCGYYDQTFANPIWADNVANEDTPAHYPIWQHEVGTDKNVLGSLTAINAYIESGALSWVAQDPNRQQAQLDAWITLYRFEPDIIQSGDMTFLVNGRQYARSPVVTSAYPLAESTVKIDLWEQRREMTLRFESNVIGGNFEFGQNLMQMEIGDASQSQPGEGA
jgi:hypothetical protein